MMAKDPLAEVKSKSFDSGKRKSTHICELSRGSDSNLLKLQPTAPLRSRLKRLFQKSIIVTEKHPATRFYLRSHAAVSFEKKRHGRSPNWWVIHPCSSVRFGWEIVMCITYLFCFIGIPYFSAFYMLNTSTYHWKESILVPGYVVCIVDIFLNFITGYTSSNSHEIFLDPGVIASHYTRGYFLIDLLTSIPYSWILQDYHSMPGPTSKNSNFATIMIELLPLLKLLRLRTLYNFLMQFWQVLGIGHNVAVSLWIALLTALIFHWAACFTYGFPFVLMHATGSRIEDSDTWFNYITDLEDHSADQYRLYQLSFYNGLTGLCAIDSTIVADTKEHNTGETIGDKIVTCVLLLFGTLYQLYLIVVILQWVESENAPETRYQQIRNSLRLYIRKKQVPPSLERKLLDYYQYSFRDKCFKENAIVSAFSDHLKDEIVMHTCRQLMDSVAIFWNVPKLLVGSIITALKPEIFLSNEIIFKCDDEGNCMYFIGSGTLAVITYTGKEICHLEDGAHFGESSLLYPGFRRPVTVIALEKCELFKLERKDFNRLIPTNSDLHQRMRRAVKEQMAIVVQIENDATLNRGNDLENWTSNLRMESSSEKPKNPED
ncbi:potassium/sodium hyperpolarization-activated cyclic nucleotide-gated channel 1-like [Neodiprion virginianus]|uniref:potassium/sodium hyperpolarization-activated cyclic nucleotide-gated channel 1-like n=1 Tax=Neodiprion virginianus TaxID=2961670 RepID=UPI001EE6A639|nr:potassium/sodium hyperpolarization-activated cyclic nucleotide-gated channel 1-like [Neodiprion virginianus]